MKVGFSLTMSEDEMRVTVVMEADDTWTDEAVITALREFAGLLEEEMKESEH